MVINSHVSNLIVSVMPDDAAQPQHLLSMSPTVHG